MDNIIPESLSSTGTAPLMELQTRIREFVAQLAYIKKQKEDVKKANASLHVLKEDIMDRMVEQGLSTCKSSGYKFTVKEKTKMKSATAKAFLVHVKDYFKISDSQMASFMDKVEAERKADAMVIATLDAKPIKRKSSDQSDGDDDDATTAAPTTSLSHSLDDIYSR